MANFTHGDKWTGQVSVSKADTKVGIPVGGTYCESDIELQVTVPVTTAQQIVGTGSSVAKIIPGSDFQTAQGASGPAGYGYKLGDSVNVFNSGYIANGLSEEAWWTKGIKIKSGAPFTVVTGAGTFTWVQDSSGNVWIE